MGVAQSVRNRFNQTGLNLVFTLSWPLSLWWRLTSSVSLVFSIHMIILSVNKDTFTPLYFECTPTPDQNFKYCLRRTDENGPPSTDLGVRRKACSLPLLRTFSMAFSYGPFLGWERFVLVAVHWEHTLVYIYLILKWYSIWSSALFVSTEIIHFSPLGEGKWYCIWVQSLVHTRKCCTTEQCAQPVLRVLSVILLSQWLPYAWPQLHSMNEFKSFVHSPVESSCYWTSDTISGYFVLPRYLLLLENSSLHFASWCQQVFLSQA